MSDLGDLKGRVATAVEKLSLTLDTRRQRTESLGAVLANIEGTFNARTAEMAACTARIDALTEVSAQLVSLVELLVGMVDQSLNGDLDGPFHPVTALAAGGLGDAGIGAARPQPALGANVIRFEDVSAGTLAAELAAEAADPVELPPVAAAAAAAARDGVAPGQPATPAGAIDSDSLDDAGDALRIAPHFAEEISEKLATALGSGIGGAEAGADGEDAEDADEAADEVELEFIEGFDAEDDLPPLDDSDTVEIDIPEPDAPVRAGPDPQFDHTDADIKAMMSRLEKAATRAQARIDGDPTAAAPNDAEKVA